MPDLAASGSVASAPAMSNSRHPSWMRSPWAGWLLITAVLWCWSLARVPIPATNETHYLSKARHYWDPAWIRDDLFLESANPHLFFYATVGSLTAWLSFEQAAIWGRLIGCAVVAAGWWRLCCSLRRRDVTTAGTAAPPLTEALAPLAILLLLQSSGTWSGEWLVGGIESKVLSYGCLFWGLGSLFDGHWRRAAVAYGLAVSFHPLVGLWGALCSTGMLLWEASQRRLNCPPLGILTAATGLFLATSVIGLMPALQMLVKADPIQGAQADYLMVGHRLSHHLDPLTFPASNWRYMGLLLALWGLLRLAHGSSSTERRWEMFVLCSTFVAVAGIVIAWGPRPWDRLPNAMLRAKLLKFYPFRLADLLIPMAVAFEVVRYAQWQIERRWPNQPESWRRLLIHGGCLLSLGCSAWLPGPDRNPSRMSPEKLADWIATLDWVRTQSPSDAVCYAANERWACKWYAQRPEYVNYKDCPQDAASLMLWNDRLRVISDWHDLTFADNRCTAAELRELHRRTGITHLITGRMGPIDAEPTFERGAFHVFVIGTTRSQQAE
ncbi:MAG: hypothetical protein KDA58_13365 [Planctomycetaceae bacterium]|nr:hypothetical protein [Planctomycetaceae bacterium]